MQITSKQTSTVPRTKAEKEKDRERKIGHRRVGVGGEITYKKIQSTQIMGSIQLGILNNSTIYVCLFTDFIINLKQQIFSNKIN